MQFCLGECPGWPLTPLLVPHCFNILDLIGKHDEWVQVQPVRGKDSECWGACVCGEMLLRARIKLLFHIFLFRAQLIVIKVCINYYTPYSCVHVYRMEGKRKLVVWYTSQRTSLVGSSLERTKYPDFNKSTRFASSILINGYVLDTYIVRYMLLDFFTHR